MSYIHYGEIPHSDTISTTKCTPIAQNADFPALCLWLLW